MNPGLLHWELGVLATGPPGKSLAGVIRLLRWINFPGLFERSNVIASVLIRRGDESRRQVASGNLKRAGELLCEAKYPEGTHLCQHLDFGLLASRSVRE